MNKISAKRAQELATNMTLPNGVTVDKMSNMFKIILQFHGVGNVNKTEHDLLHSILQANNITVQYVMKFVAPKCDDMLKACQWKGSVQRCDELYQSIPTIEGICCSFNYYGQSKSNFPL